MAHVKKESGRRAATLGRSDGPAKGSDMLANGFDEFADGFDELADRNNKSLRGAQAFMAGINNGGV